MAGTPFQGTDLPFPRQDTPRGWYLFGFSTAIDAAKAIVQEECSAACAFAVIENDTPCTCRCGGQTHGLMTDLSILYDVLDPWLQRAEVARARYYERLEMDAGDELHLVRGEN